VTGSRSVRPHAASTSAGGRPTAGSPRPGRASGRRRTAPRSRSADSGSAGSRGRMCGTTGPPAVSWSRLDCPTGLKCQAPPLGCRAGAIGAGFSPPGEKRNPPVGSRPSPDGPSRCSWPGFPRSLGHEDD
jgi:hypothetical protein